MINHNTPALGPINNVLEVASSGYGTVLLENVTWILSWICLTKIKVFEKRYNLENFPPSYIIIVLQYLD